MTRSQTDEQLAARWDPEPWACFQMLTFDGGKTWERVEVRRHSEEHEGDVHFDPRVECIPSLDSYPWRIEVINRADHEHVAARDGERLADPSWVTFWDRATEQLVFDPQIPRPPVNPILWMARDYRKERLTMNNPKGWDHVQRVINSYVAAHWDDFTSEEIDHARKVLTRLAALA